MHNYMHKNSPLLTPQVDLNNNNNNNNNKSYKAHSKQECIVIKTKCKNKGKIKSENVQTL